ncbi:BLUF domain-containing protein [Ectothiorhodospiraceae bacterium BW-2]|nr:BLUF domain-containing protein [Ectothiorhodospiraceae bacterium BW-2]
MYQIVYMSETARPLSEADLANILAKARSYNRQHDITGILLVHNNLFLQLLEGEKESVLSLMEQIATDNRHANLEVVLDVENRPRICQDWSMGFKSLDGKDLQQFGNSLTLAHLRERFANEPNILLELMASFLETD